MPRKPPSERVFTRQSFIRKEGEFEFVRPDDAPVMCSSNNAQIHPSSQNPAVATELISTLISIYEEIMWLARRPTPGITAGRARGWYTHIMAESVKRQIRRFSGLVSA